jgi:hypothetical protein
MAAGADRVSVAPGQKAAQAADKWLARVTAAKDKFARNSAAVSLEEWKQAYKTVGVPRVAQGAQLKQHKMQNFLTDFLSYLQRGAATIDAMPSVTIEDGIAKAVAQIRYNSKYQRGSNK